MSSNIVETISSNIVDPMTANFNVLESIAVKDNPSPSAITQHNQEAIAMINKLEPAATEKNAEHDSQQTMISTPSYK